MRIHTVEAGISDPKIREKVVANIAKYRKERVAGDIAYYAMLFAGLLAATGPAVLEREPRLAMLTFAWAFLVAISSELATGYYDGKALITLNYIEQELLHLLEFTHQHPLQSHDMIILDIKMDYLEKHILEFSEQLAVTE
jgi:hypothetical protein